MNKTDSYQRWIPKRFKYLVLGILVLSISSSLQGTTQTIQIPSLAEAARRADQMAPKDLTQIEVDESIRDRLRLDPEWQPILQAVRQDIMILKWGNSKLVDPAWKHYGPKVYPLLDYYIRSGDPAREAYGMLGLHALGKPYTTLWLERQLQRHADSSNFSLVDPDFYPSKTYNQDDCTTGDCWEKVFGLEDSVTRDHLIQVARQNLEPKTSPAYEDQFNLAFLKAVGVEKYTNPWEGGSSEFNPKDVPELQKWLQLEKLRSPDANQVQTAISSYIILPDEAQLYILIDYLGKVKAGDISPIGKAVLRSLATDTKSKDRMWAIAELDRHGDSQGTQLLSEIVNGDLSQLNTLTLSASEGESRYSYQHAMLLILAIAKKYPQSKFTRGCVEYGDLRGASYIGKLSRGKAIRSKNEAKTPTERVRDWQQWLKRYPDHPGADDATYFLAKSLQDEDDFVGATRQLIRLMTQKPGDRDALELAWPHLRTYLDVGLSVEQLKVVVQEQHDTAIAPLLQYALAVRQARLQNYTEALSLTENLDLTKMPSDILGIYYYTRSSRLSSSKKTQEKMQSMLVEQRQRWQELHNIQIENTPESLYRMASHWIGYGGWKNGYLPFWEGNRVFQLPFLNPAVCKNYGVCNINLRSQNQIVSLYQSSSQNAIALSLYQKILSSSRTASQLREKTLYMVAETLLSQWELSTTTETIALHPLPGMAGEPQLISLWKSKKIRDFTNEMKESLKAVNLEYIESGSGYIYVFENQLEYEVLNFEHNNKGSAVETVMTTIASDYQSQVDTIIATLIRDFPNSSHIDDLMFSSYFFSGKQKYLSEILKVYPNSDRAAEAKFLIEQSKLSSPKKR